MKKAFSGKLIASGHAVEDNGRANLEKIDGLDQEGNRNQSGMLITVSD